MLIGNWSTLFLFSFLNIKIYVFFYVFPIYFLFFCYWCGGGVCAPLLAFSFGSDWRRTMIYIPLKPNEQVAQHLVSCFHFMPFYYVKENWKFQWMPQHTSQKSLNIVIINSCYIVATYNVVHFLNFLDI